MRRTLTIRVLGLLLTGLLLLTMIGWTPRPETDTAIEVKDVDELVAAIGPNVSVTLLPGEYDLASAASYGKDTGNRYCRWEEASDGFELNIKGIDGLTLRGAGRDETTLLAEDRYANVLSFTGCKNVVIASLTAGHSPEPGYCAGGVLHLTNCGDVEVEDCGFFGCGTMGVWASNSDGLTITASRIYECSENAVSVDNCRNVQVLDSEIDHNGWKREEPASCLFQAYGGDGFTVDRCRIHDNSANHLLQCGDTRNVRFVSDRVEYNTLRYAFALFEYTATVDGCAFHRNEMGGWYAEYELSSLAARDLQGKELTEEDLNAMEIRPIELIGSEEIVFQEPTTVPVGGEITVKTVDEFVAAIGPDRTIILDGTTFSLADAAGYGSAEGQYFRWESCYDGPQLTILDVSNLTIRAKADDPTATTLMATPRYANVLGFRNCSNVRVSGLTMGHTEGPSDCSGAVLDFENCNGITLDRCRLYGCGTLGVNAYICSDLRLLDCEIYDCSIGGVVLLTVYGASFQNCRIHDVPSPMLSMYDFGQVFWNGAALYDNYYDVSATGALVPVNLG